MEKMFIAIPLVLVGMLFSSTALAHDDGHEKVHKGGQGTQEEGGGGSAMERDRKYRAMSHEYKEEHSGDHSKEHYEKKYGKYEHEKKEMKEEGMKMKEMKQKRMDEGSKM